VECLAALSRAAPWTTPGPAAGQRPDSREMTSAVMDSGA